MRKIKLLLGLGLMFCVATALYARQQELVRFCTSGSLAYCVTNSDGTTGFDCKTNGTGTKDCSGTQWIDLDPD